MLPRTYLFVKYVCLNAASDGVHLNGRLRKLNNFKNNFFCNTLFQQV